MPIARLNLVGATMFGGSVNPSNHSYCKASIVPHYFRRQQARILWDVVGLLDCVQCKCKTW
jgi:hypothetical protein